jgi:hypothetical protein
MNSPGFGRRVVQTDTRALMLVPDAPPERRADLTGREDLKERIRSILMSRIDPANAGRMPRARLRAALWRKGGPGSTSRHTPNHASGPAFSGSKDLCPSNRLCQHGCWPRTLADINNAAAWCSRPSGGIVPRQRRASRRRDVRWGSSWRSSNRDTKYAGTFRTSH